MHAIKVRVSFLRAYLLRLALRMLFVSVDQLGPGSPKTSVWGKYDLRRAQSADLSLFQAPACPFRCAPGFLWCLCLLALFTMFGCKATLIMA